MEMIDILKSIVGGITEQTKMGLVKWIDDSKISTVEKEKYSYIEDKQGLSPSLYYRMDRNTMLEVHFFLYRDGSISRSFMWIKNDGLQEGNISIDASLIPDYVNLEKILYDTFITPKLSRHPRNFNSDMVVLSGMASKCGLDVVREIKLNSILGETESKKSWISKLF
jgi:hypothetical protein